MGYSSGVVLQRKHPLGRRVPMDRRLDGVKQLTMEKQKIHSIHFQIIALHHYNKLL